MLKWGWIDIDARNAAELLNDPTSLLTTFSPLLRSVVLNPGTRILLVCSADQKEPNAYADDVTTRKQKQRTKSSDVFWQRVVQTFF